MLAGVGNLLTIQGISANPPGTANGDSDTVSNLRRDTQLRSRRAPRVCALLTLCCSRAVCVCVCVCVCARQGWSDWGEAARPAPTISPHHWVSSSRVSISTVSLTLLSELPLCCVSQTLDKWLLLRLCSSFLHPCRLVCSPAQVGTHRNRQAWIWPRPERPPLPLRPGQG